MTDLRELYQELIIDHGRHPRNFKNDADANCVKEGFNPLCGDRLTLFLRTNDDKIIDACFQGSGCAISVASASLMTETLKGKSLVGVKKIFHTFHDLIMGVSTVDNELGKLTVFSGVRDYPSRVKCATLAWHTLMAAIEEK